MTRSRREYFSHLSFSFWAKVGLGSLRMRLGSLWLLAKVAENLSLLDGVKFFGEVGGCCGVGDCDVDELMFTCYGVFNAQVNAESCGVFDGGEKFDFGL